MNAPHCLYGSYKVAPGAILIPELGEGKGPHILSKEPMGLEHHPIPAENRGDFASSGSRVDNSPKGASETGFLHHTFAVGSSY